MDAGTMAPRKLVPEHGTATSGPWIVVTEQDDLLAELRAAARGTLLTATSGLALATEISCAAALFDANKPGCLFIDWRDRWTESRLNTTLTQLRSFRASHPRVTIVGVSAQGYPPDAAAEIDLTCDSHLLLPFDGRTIELALTSTRQGDAGRLANPRVLKGKSTRFFTYMPELAATLDRLQIVAGHVVTLLLVGETGSGKTTLARLLHELSPRADERFLALPCGALPADLVESELFGHVKGAFTGADRTMPGKFEAAESGTLLLDEIDVLRAKDQVKLLRVVETGEYEPVGSVETRHTGARLIVASNTDLRSLLQTQKFRADLYYRLSVLEFHVPPLRARPHDIVPLAMELLQQCSAEHSLPIRYVQPGVLTALRGYDWPGNLRELKNHLRHAVLFCRDGCVTCNDLSPAMSRRDEPRSLPDEPTLAAPLARQVAASEREILESALAANKFKRSATANALGISRVGLYKKMKKHGMIAVSPDVADEDGQDETFRPEQPR